MSKPMFRLTKKIPLTIYRKGSGYYERGVWVEGVTEEIVREVNIQPLRYEEVMLLPESQRNKQWWTLYCAEDIRAALPTTTSITGWDADEFDYDGMRFRVMKAKKYAIGVLDHYKAQAAQIEVTAQ